MSEIGDVLDGRSRWCVIAGDFRDVLADLPRVDHVICDPPYSKRVHQKSRAGARKTPLLDGNGKQTRCAISREVTFGFGHLTPELRLDLAEAAQRIARRWSLFFTDVEGVSAWIADLERAGLEHVRVGAWRKIGGAPQFTGDRPGIGFEAIEIAHPVGRKRWNGRGKHGVWTHVVERRQYKFASARIHPAQKPVKLMLDLVRDFTDPDELVLDPVCGSASTGVACLRLGRRFIGVEVDATFAAGARARLEKEAAAIAAGAA